MAAWSRTSHIASVRSGPSISFEFFPPKDDGSEAQLWEAIRHLERIRPDFVSVTYGAGGTTQDRTIRVTERIARETSLVPLAHLTCVGATVPQLRRVVGAYAAAGIRNILALRGDPPGNVGGMAGHRGWALPRRRLVELIRGLGDFTIGVAASRTSTRAVLASITTSRCSCAKPMPARVSR